MKVLFTLKHSDEEFDQIRELGYEVLFSKEGKKSTLNQMSQEELESIDVLVTYNSFDTLDISKMKNLKFIQLASTGFDQVPKEKVLNRDIIISNNKGGYSIPISEWIVFNVLQIYKNSKSFYKKQENKIWQQDFSIEEIYGKRIGFLGTGTIACETAKRLKAFGVEIWGCNTDGRSVKYFDKCVPKEEMNELLKNSDVVISTIPGTKETERMINKDKFTIMKNGSVFINVGRGKVVNEEDLFEYSSKFRGIALDVFENEPLSIDNKLWGLDNIIITPHNAWVSQQSDTRHFNLFYNNLKKYMENKPIDNLIQIEKGY